MRIETNNRQNLCRIDRRRVERLTACLARRASALAPGRVWNEISVVLTDDAGIRMLNERYLARSEITDVISLRYDPIPGDKGQHDAEIMVNVERAVAEGRSRRRSSPSRELALYIAHGCDHLAGEDDNGLPERRRMRKRELRWLKQADDDGLTDGLIRLAGRRMTPASPAPRPSRNGSGDR